MKITHRSIIAIVLVCLLVPLVPISYATSTAQEAIYDYTTIDFPSAPCTYACGINDAGQIVGCYGIYATVGRGFLFGAGSYATIDFPGTAYTEAYGINDAGQIVGTYWDEISTQHGFLLSGGSFTTIAFPGALHTCPSGINDTGQIVGGYWDGGSACQGFLLSGGSFTAIHFPGALHTTCPSGINDAGQIVGTYWDEISTQHGFLLSGGSFTTIAFPGALGTAAYGINDAGQIVGGYRDGTGAWYGFLFSGGSFTTIDFPGAYGTQACGINDAGQIAGYYWDASDHHGFVATLTEHPVASFTYSPEKPYVNQEITFDASSSYDPDGQIVTYQWNFGDGDVDEGGAATHAFTETGEYTVTLTVTDNHGLDDSVSQVLEVRPLPVLLVHGINSSPALWNTLRNYLIDQGYPSDLVVAVDYCYGGGLNTLGSINSHARSLKNYIDANWSDAPAVNIVAHSMGGLVTRAYIKKGGSPKTEVNKFIMIGTPNHGSELILLGDDVIDTIQALCQLDGPAGDAFGLLLEAIQLTKDLTDNSIKDMTPGSSFLDYLGPGGLNANEVYTIAGTSETWGDLPVVGWLYEKLAEPYLKGPDDSVVRVASVSVGGSSPEEYDVAHCFVEQSETEYEPILHRVWQILTDNGMLMSEQGLSGSLLVPGPSANSEYLFADSGVLPPGEERWLTIPISLADEVTFLFTWNGDDLGNIELTTPSGEVIERTAQSSDLKCGYQYDGTVAIGEQYYSIVGPESAVWRFIVSSDSTSDTPFTLLIMAETGLSLTTSVDKHICDPAEEIAITCSLMNFSTPVTDATVTTEIERPDGISEVLTMFDDGAHNDGQVDDGIYGNQFTNTISIGTYHIVASATDSGGNYVRESTPVAVWVEQYPDLTLSSEDISFSVDNPIAGEQITINAVIHNIGDVEANEATIMFYDGDPASGSLIGEDTISVPVGGTETASASWTALAGTHEMVGVISPFNSFLEKDYANNEASRTINVSSAATATCMVSLQGSSRPNPTGWEMPVTVKFFAPGANVLSGTPVYVFSGTTTRTAEGAALQVTGISPGTYDITVVSEHTLMNVKRNVVITGPTDSVDMGTLLEGDWNGNLAIDWEDLGTVLLTYDKCEGAEGFDPAADFNRNGCIDWEDLGLVLINYDKTSPVEVP